MFAVSFRSTDRLKIVSKGFELKMFSTQQDLLTSEITGRHRLPCNAHFSFKAKTEGNLKEIAPNV